jgi:hypothetical protein
MWTLPQFEPRAARLTCIMDKKKRICREGGQ